MSEFTIPVKIVHPKDILIQHSVLVHFENFPRELDEIDKNYLSEVMKIFLEDFLLTHYLAHRVEELQNLLSSIGGDIDESNS